LRNISPNAKREARIHVSAVPPIIHRLFPSKSNGQSYIVYAEPVTGLAAPGGFSNALDDLCAANGPSPCAAPAVDTTFHPRVLPASP
jgi:hypothetical protein